MKKLLIIIPSNRFKKLPRKTVAVIERTKTSTIFVKQNLSPYYQNHPFIKEVISHQIGASRARNLGIKSALKQKADILAFTDDDCIITEKWVKNVHNTFNDPKIDIVFGRVLPYQPKKHPSEYCPCTFSKNNTHPISSPVSTPVYIGMGSNFAATPKLIHRVGLFSPLIGPGTKIPGGEDADYIIRSVKSNFPVHYNHQALIYHNKWLPKTDLQNLYQRYTLAIAYVYSYHAIHTDPLYSKILLKEFLQEMSYYPKYFKQIIHPYSFLKLIFKHNLIIYNFFKGCCYALFYP